MVVGDVVGLVVTGETVGDAVVGETLGATVGDGVGNQVETEQSLSVSPAV